MTLPFFDAERVRGSLSYAAAIEVLEQTFAAERLPDAPPRSRLERGDGLLLLMPAWGDDALGVKLVTVKESNPLQGLPLIHGVYVLFSADTLQPLALIDGATLTELRTAAVSALATRYLAPPDAGRLVVFGAGVQAEAHVRALAAVRKLQDVAIVARSPDSAARLVRRLAEAGFPARPGGAGDLERADLVCTCTTSPEPLFDGSVLPQGAHVNAVGAHTPTTRELDDVTVRRSFVVVETIDSALSEAGDLLIPLGTGAVDPGRVPAADLSRIVRGTSRPPTQRDLTLFKSVGVAFEDLAVAQAVFRNS